MRHLLTIVLFIVVGACSIEPEGKVKGNLGGDANSEQKQQNENAGQSDDLQTTTSGNCSSSGKGIAIVISQCKGCHGPGQSSPLLDSESSILAALTQVKDSVSNNRMPPNAPLSPEFKAEIDKISLPALALVADEGITFNQHLRPVYNTHCLYCHSHAGTRPHSPYMDTLGDISDEASGSHAEVTQGGMPPRNADTSMPASAKALMTQWKSNGYKLGSEPAEIASVDYQTHIKPFIQANCAGCHEPGRTAPDLTDDAVIQASAAVILADLENKTMPPGGFIYPAEVNMVRTWKEALDAKLLGDSSNSSESCP